MNSPDSDPVLPSPGAGFRRRVRETAKLAACLAMDSARFVTGRRDPLVPPTRLMFDGPRGFEKFKSSGRETLSALTEIGGLKPSHAVLDVGSGIGRKTVPLTAYLLQEASYDGIEIVRAGVDWCSKHITPRFPNFRFHHADVYNRHYNPRGMVKAKDYRFPFEDSTFDFVLLTSVFTHMLPDDVRNYVSEIARVLRPKGRLFVTYYLLTESAKQSVTEGRGAYRLPVRTSEFWAEDPHDLEAITALDEVFVKGLYASSGLVIEDPIRYGPWSRGVPHGQDIVIAVRD